MNKKILQVFYGADALPYKDKERTVHFPIVGNAIQNANNTTQIKFYFDRLVEENEQTTFVAVSKLPNGKIGSKILETYDDEELGEQYALLDLDSFYTQYKGDVFISLQGFQGGVRVEQDAQGIYQIYGTPVIAATGSIKLAINYAPSFVGSGEIENVTLQQVLGELSTKLGVRQETLHVEELPTVGNPDIWYVVNDDEDEPNKQNIYIWNATTQTYIWVGDNTLDLGEYYTKEQGEEFESNIEQTIQGIASGTPNGTFNNLTDLETAYPNGDNHIYVCLDTGDWYYWNATNEEWTSGGQYLSTGNAVPTSRTIAGINLGNNITSDELNKGLGNVKGVFPDAQSLNNAFPTGDSNNYLVTNTNSIFYWNGSSWVKGTKYGVQNLIRLPFVSEEQVVKIQNDSLSQLDLSSISGHWETGAIDINSGNVSPSGTNRFRTSGVIIVPIGSSIYVETNDDNIFFQTREYENFGPSYFSSACNRYLDIKVQREYVITKYKYIRIVISADGTSYTLSDVLSKVKVIVNRKTSVEDFKKYGGYAIPLSDIIGSLVNGGIRAQTASSASSRGLDYDGDTSYQNSNRRISFRFATNPNSYYKLIGKDYCISKLWGYNSGSNSSTSSEDSVTFYDVSEMSGYPYLRFAFSLRDEKGTSISISDLSKLVDGMYLVEFKEKAIGINKKITFATYNIGHYANGQSYEPTQTADNLYKYFRLFGSFGADLIALCEDNNPSYFDALHTINSKWDFILKLFRFYNVGPQYNYNCNSLASKYPIKTSRNVDYTTRNQQRYYSDNVVDIDGFLIHVIVTHLDLGTDGNRTEQMQELLTLLANYKYFILAGDFNNGFNNDELDVFKNAGYNLANLGNFGEFGTYYSSTSQAYAAEDHIITSQNIRIENVKVINSDLSDHLPLIAELLIN